MGKFNIAKFKLIFIVLATLTLPLLFGEYIPEELKSFSYAVSLSMKSLLVMVIPFIIFSFLFSSLMSLGTGAVIFIILLLTMVFTSNLLAIMLGYTAANFTLPFMNLSILSQSSEMPDLVPFFDFSFPKIISNEPAMIMGLILGAFFSFKQNNYAEKVGKKLNHYSMLFLRKGFLPLLPIFILGFVFKLEHEDLLHLVLTKYAPMFFVIVGVQLSYIYFLYLVAAGFNPKVAIGYLKNMIPAYLTGFSTISSAATMPVTIMCTEKNMNNSSFARTIIPATTNIHTLGSAVGLTVLALGTMLAFGMPMPTIDIFLKFALFYAIAKFAVAGIPGGVVIVVSPLLEAYLGFSSEMIGIITALYMLFDPFGTAANCTCNGAFAIIFRKVYNKFTHPLTTCGTRTAEEQL
ncbi:MAG: cation:dicarboxylate symporter family transporter [Rickettsiales bacterium]